MKRRCHPLSLVLAFRAWGALLALGLVLTTAAWSQQAGFLEVRPLPQGRQMHGAAVLGDYLYVFGGAKETLGWTDSTQVAPVYPDGSLGAWLETTPLPENRHYIANGTVTLNDVVYIAGGAVGESGHANTVLWTRPMPGGNLEPWRRSTPFTAEKLSFVTAVSTPGHIYLLGGLREDGVPSNAVIYGSVAADGSVGNWQSGVPLPKRLWWHHAAVSGGRLWIWAGLPTSEYSPISTSVYSAPLLSTGDLGLWREESAPVPVPIFGAITATAGSYLLSFCPRVSADESLSDVWFNYVSEQGLGPWQRVTTQLPNRIYFATANDYRRNSVYVIGGKVQRGSGDPNGRVFFFRLAAGTQTDVTRVASASPTPYGQLSAGSVVTFPTTQASAMTPSQFSYQMQARLASGAIPGFMTYDQARRAAQGPPAVPLVVYFHNNVSRACQEQIQKLQDPLWSSVSRSAAFAWIDIEESPQIAQQLGIFRVPTWVMFDKRGNPLGQNYGVLTVEQIAQAVGRYAAAP